MIELLGREFMFGLISFNLLLGRKIIALKMKTTLAMMTLSLINVLFYSQVHALLRKEKGKFRFPNKKSRVSTEDSSSA